MKIHSPAIDQSVNGTRIVARKQMPVCIAGLLLATLAATGAAAQSTPAGQCDYSDAQLYNGWGWNPVTSESCPPIDNSQNSSTTPSGVPVCSSRDSDSDNDGWGWENDRSCIVTADIGSMDTGSGDDGDNDNSSDSSGSACVDSDGDGWGWNGVASCRMQTTPADDAPSNPANDSPDDLTNDLPNDLPNTAACIDSDGDGWGWNGSASCRVDQPTDTDSGGESVAAGSCTQPASGTTVVSSTGPVRSTGNAFYPNNGPQCVSPGNQFNGPGLRFGDFLLINNAWNGDKSSWNWSQCISLSTANDGSVMPSWSYDWGNEDALQPGYQEWEVKSYPEIIYGVKSQSEKSADCETTGLPVPYHSMPTIDINYSYRAPQTNRRSGDLPDSNNVQQTVTGGDRNVAIESFLHSSCDIERGAQSNREFELMVWLQHGNERLPSGSPPVALYTDNAGREYDVYVKIPADPGYIAYVAREQSTSGSINWNEFFADAKSNAGTYGIKSINSNWCLANILFGSEIWWGEGSLTMDYLQIERSY